MALKTHYLGHDRAYQEKHADPEFSGWSRGDDWADDWQRTWLPLVSRPTFPQTGRLLELGEGQFSSS